MPEPESGESAATTFKKVEASIVSEIEPAGSNTLLVAVSEPMTAFPIDVEDVYVFVNQFVPVNLLKSTSKVDEADVPAEPVIVRLFPMT